MAKGDFSNEIRATTFSSESVDLSGYMDDSEVVPRFKAPISFIDEVVDELKNGEAGPIGDLSPWRKADDRLRFRAGEVTLWMGFNGHGKSFVLTQLFLDLALQGKVGMIASFEMTPRSTLLRMVKQAWGHGMPPVQFVRKFFEFLTGRLWLFDLQGKVSPALVMAAARYARSMYACDHICIDSLMKCVRGEDDMNGQKEFVDGLCAFAMKRGPHIHLVHHSRKKEDENSPPGKMDAKGSGSITDQVDNSISVWRNKRKEALIHAGQAAKVGEPDCVLTIDKQRHYSWEGQIKLWFDWRSGLYCEDEGRLPNYRALIENATDS